MSSFSLFYTLTVLEFIILLFVNAARCAAKVMIFSRKIVITYVFQYNNNIFCIKRQFQIIQISKNCRFIEIGLLWFFILSRLTTKRTNPLIFSINADCQWVNCSQNETDKPFWKHLMIKTW